MKVLITGITGFAGSNLAEYILNLNAGIEVHGTKRYTSSLDNIAGFIDKIKLWECELRDQNSVDTIIAQIQPDKIFHLAAQTFVPVSFLYPGDTLVTNILSTVSIFESVKKFNLNPVIHLCSTSEVYGRVEKHEIPIKETNPLRPQNPYAISKVTADLLGQQYFTTYKLKIVISRAFGYIGPGAKDVFAYSSFAKQIAQIEHGVKEPVIYVGNLDSVRTFLDIRDVAEAYWILSEKCPPGEIYNIGSTNTMTVGEVLTRMLALSPRGNEIQVKVDPTRLRPVDVVVQVPDCTKFNTQTGWQPKVSFTQTLTDLLNLWRQKIKIYV